MEPPITPLEIASGIVGGAASEPVAPLAPTGDPVAAAKTTVERSVRAALLRPPCLVSFSGGLDSSVVLGAAVCVARREGLPLPIPITWRFAEAPQTEETAWQEAVIAELGVPDWIRLEGGESLDLVGPVAAATIARHGVLYPHNAHFHVPLLERAAGGSLLTGIGGDDIFRGWRWVARPRQTPRARLASQVPPLVRRLQFHALHRTRLPWLQRPARLRAQWAASDHGLDPARWDERVAFQASRRALALSRSTLDRLGDDHGVQVVSPLLDPAFLGAAARAGGPTGLGQRRTALRTLLGDLVPHALEDRQTKAVFGEVFYGRASRAAAAAFDGRGVDPTVVDRAALRQIWARGEHLGLTALLLQQVTLGGPLRIVSHPKC